ncbi:phage antirepressor N-terminal domain-containing protein [Serratia marcescens]|uniref:phage antirepressor N-terminal domain-containing protein n=1 Tax=Serratia marcescens TaxID=615 RepID=UPI0009AF7097|nr:phage antirepressor N-terminal domain-containing protein [Serratia marcescens]MDM3533644.1 phage antirepressor N-terminal domain-containing protein [Serratia marcescens]MDM3540223.1 phage antirepressor N-terminal domain-containing protein [Serratia marcescens]
MNSISILEAVNTSSVQFHGQPIITAMAAGVAYVAMRPIVENIGIDWASQFVKLKNQGEKFGCCDITTPSKGGIQKMLCIPLKKLNGWLFSINPSKVRADIRDKLIAYQEECFTVLHDYWTKGAAVRKSGTTVDERTPLRDAVNMLVSKKHLMYPEAYSIIHQRFAVESIEDLTPEQIPQAIEYVHRVVLDGEYLGKQIELQMPARQFDDSELYQLVCLWSVALLIRQDTQKITEALAPLGLPIAVKVNANANDLDGFIRSAGLLLLRESSHIAKQVNPPLNWRLEITRMQSALH